MGVALLVIRDINAIDTMLNAQLIGLGISVVLALSFLYTRQRQLDKPGRARPLHTIRSFSMPYPLR